MPEGLTTTSFLKSCSSRYLVTIRRQSLAKFSWGMMYVGGCTSRTATTTTSRGSSAAPSTMPRRTTASSRSAPTMADRLYRERGGEEVRHPDRRVEKDQGKRVCVSRHSRGLIKMEVIIEKCMHCGACVGTCPQNAIYLNDVVLIFNEKCNRCGRASRRARSEPSSWRRRHEDESSTT